MQNKNNNTNVNNGVSNGFLIGFILGVLVTVLLTTKKGREILRELLDKSIQKITALENSLEKTEQKQNPDDENDYIKPKPEDIKKEIRYLAEDKKINEKGGSSSREAVHRFFFRKSPKKNL